MDYASILSYLTPIFTWLSSGTVGIVAGVLGLGGLLTTAFFVFRKVSAQLADSQFQSSLTNNSRVAGEISAETSKAAANNTQIIDTMAGLEKNRLKELEKSAPPPKP